MDTTICKNSARALLWLTVGVHGSNDYYGQKNKRVQNDDDLGATLFFKRNIHSSQYQHTYPSATRGRGTDPLL